MLSQPGFRFTAQSNGQLFLFHLNIDVFQHNIHNLSNVVFCQGMKSDNFIHAIQNSD